MMVVALENKHWIEVAEIYKEGIATNNATFRKEVPSWNEWSSKCHQHSRFVVLDNENTVIGWAALAPVSNRYEYRGVAEVSVYVKLSSAGKRIGSKLMEKIIESSEENHIWSLYSSLFPENIGSVKLHEKYGFRCIGFREKIAQLNGVWRDTVLYERRSKKYELL
ncbi:GNAT family N-acetyltransferase [uncultured Tenacibaculum sp.]|uniref:GNAT family N-acetyltransferase n=2 Tax=Tenacibaculum TaxID=104267 RepID=UPI001049C37D|nr:GNAT family N-acetyltransferase [uncultured Tenacibaculum sp.]TCI92297.1 N-acetyltransferase family protein [Tenacibaculum sp. M341]